MRTTGPRFALALPDVFAYFLAPLPWSELIRRTVREIFDDNCPGLAAQLAFYLFLALFPALLFLVTYRVHS